MNNINTMDRVSYAPTKSSKLKNLGYGVMLLSLLNFSSPVKAQSTVSNNNNTNDIELSIISSSSKEQHGGYSIPPVYKDKIESILKKNLPVVSIDGTSSWMFTMDFVLKEMESDRGISKDNQLLFIWDIICKQLTGEYIIDGESEDSDMLNQYKTSFRKERACGQRYREGIMPFIEKKKAEYRQHIAQNEQQIAEYNRQIAESQKIIDEALRQSAEYRQQSAEYRQQSAEYRQQSAEYRQQSAEYIKEIEKYLNESLGLFKQFYPFFNDHRDDSRLKDFKESAKKLVPLYKEYGVPYKDILPPDVRDFYEME